MALEGKSPKEIDEAIKKQHFGLMGLKNDNPYSSQNAEADNASGSSLSLINVVFNYFNDQGEDAAGGQNSGNAEKLAHLKKSQDQLKLDQIQNMKLMNQLFDHLVKNGSPQKQRTRTDGSERKEAESNSGSLDSFLI